SGGRSTGDPSRPGGGEMRRGGGGFYARIDPVGPGVGESRRYFVGNNSGGMSRCVTPASATCLSGGAGYASVRGNWTGDTQSFILPFDIFHGGVPGGDD